MKTNQRESLQLTKEHLSQEFLTLTPTAVDALHDIICDSDINPIARVQAIGLVLDRGLGKPEECIRIAESEEQRAAARARLEAIAERIRKEVDKEDEP